MVAVDDGETVSVPELQCGTNNEFRDCLWALKRKELAREHSEKLEQEKRRIYNLDADEIKTELKQHGKSP